MGIVNESTTQNKLHHLLQTSSNPTKHKVLALISDLHYLQPQHQLFTIILHQLELPDRELHNQTILTLKSLGDKAATSEVIDGLVIEMGDDDPQIRSSTYFALGRTGGSRQTLS